MEIIQNRFYNKPRFKPINLVLDNANQAENSLRSREFFYLLGYNHFTYRKSWDSLSRTHKLCEEPYNYIHFREIESNIPDKLLCITDQDFENYADIDPINSVLFLYDLYSPQEVENKNLTIVVNKKQFKINNTRRYIRNEPRISSIRKYTDCYRVVESFFEEIGYPFTIKFTKNIYLQEIQIFHDIIEKKHQEIIDFRDFFDNLYEKPYSPLWSFLGNLLRNEALYKNLLSGELNAKMNLNHYFRLTDMVRSKYSKRHYQFMYILKQQLKKAKSKNFQILDQRKKLIQSNKKTRIQEFYNDLNSYNTRFDYFLKRLKEFCERMI